MEVRKMRQFGQVVVARRSPMVLLSTRRSRRRRRRRWSRPRRHVRVRWARSAWGVAIVLFIMSFWSVGVAIERIYTYNQARKQSKLYAPQVAKHLKDGRLKEAIALSASKDYRYSHLAKVVLAGLQEYQFQQESGSEPEPR